MMRRKNIRWCARSAMAIAVAAAASFAAQLVFAQGLRYQDADELTVDPALGQPNVQPVAAFKSNLPVVDNDNLWNYRDFGVGQPGLPTVYQSGITEDSPTLTQTLTGLTPGNSYDLYAVYWTDEDENWTIRTGTSAGNLTNYSWTGASGAQPVPGSTQGIAASTAVWAVPPPPNKEPPTVPPAPPHPHPFIFIERIADPLVMVLGRAGTATANASGQIDVFVDDTASAGGGRRTWFDGVAYAPAGTAVAVTPSLDRTTGALTLTNSTAQALQIKSYRIESQATGGLNASTWSKVSSGNPSWMVTAPIPPADPNAPFTTVLSEDGGGTTITLGANGGSMSFGNVWNKSPFDHVLVYLTLANDQLAVLAPNYVGPAIVNGDLDGSGTIDLVDFQALLNNLHVPLPTMPALSRVETYRRGEMNGDGLINIADWAAFRAAFDAANGAGAFATMLAQIPEPSSLALLIGVGMVAPLCLRRRVPNCVVASAVCLVLVSTANAVTLLKVDMNDRQADATAGPPGDNTVAGFEPFTLGGTTAIEQSVTGTAGAYTISMTSVNAAGTAVVGLDDRDRATPTTAPTLNQLYDDFIFAATAVGTGGGIDMTINGGALMPNTQYGVSIYTFDTGSTAAPQPRTANWLDGNNSNAIAFSTAFSGANSPTTDAQYKFNGVFRTDAAGMLLLRGRNTLADSSPAVFLNGLEITDELPPPPVELTLRINSSTGAVSIVNQQTVNFDMSYYEIRSVSGSLNLGGWSSLDEAEGSDPVGTGWDEVPASSANLLSEVNLQSMTSLAPGNSVSLGNAFTVGGMQDLQLTYLGPGETVGRIGNISYVTGPDALPGDFNEDGKVDAADYVVWRKTDGTAPGYNLWRTNFGRTSGSGASLGASAAVPEPSAALLGAFGMVLLITALLRKPAG